MLAGYHSSRSYEYHCSADNETLFYAMKKKTAIRLVPALLLVVYLGSYVSLRSYCWHHAPHAWGRPGNAPNPTFQNSFLYMHFSRASQFSGLPWQLDMKLFRPLAYYAYSPLVEFDLSINNHPGNPLPKWQFYGNNWP
jgi:hypothetical protein